jgi:hypothetical protein
MRHFVGMSASKGFESHPLDHLYFFQLPEFTPDDLNDKKIHLRLTEEGRRVEGVYTLWAWANPFRSGLLAIKAQGYGWNGSYPTVFTLTFDRNRASKIRRVTNQKYPFEADLGELKSPEQVPQIWEMVKADYYREIAKIGPIIDVPLRGPDPASVRLPI